MYFFSAAKEDDTWCPVNKQITLGLSCKLILLLTINIPDFKIIVTKLVSQVTRRTMK